MYKGSDLNRNFNLVITTSPIQRLSIAYTSIGSAQWVGFFNIGSGRVLNKIPGSGSGLGRVGVLKYTIGYFWVSFLLSGISGISGYGGYFWVFLGLHIYTRVIL